MTQASRKRDYVNVLKVYGLDMELVERRKGKDGDDY